MRMINEQEKQKRGFYKNQNLPTQQEKKIFEQQRNTSQ